MRLTGRGTVTDIVIVVAIMVGVAVVATVIVRAFIFGEPTTDMIALAKQLISYQRPIFTSTNFNVDNPLLSIPSMLNT
jgi:hypothetical protein